MAKAKKFDNGMEWEITPRTKSSTWIYDGDGTKSTFKLAASLSEKDLETYDAIARNLTTRKGYDLVITTVFTNKKKMTTKMVTTTIKNFYTTLAVSESRLDIGNIANFNYTVEGKNGLFAEIEDTAEKDYILGSKAKKADLVLSKGGKDVVVDLKGNDNYTVEENGNMIVTEYQGKETYNFLNNLSSDVTDYKGNDKYSFKDSKLTTGDLYTINDYAGKDSYTIENSRGVYIDDYKGNDKYVAKDINTTTGTFVGANFLITDYAGNDKYELSNVKHYSDTMMTNNVILDAKGKDKYTITDSVNVYIEDDAGADKYYLTRTSSETNLKGIKIVDKQGKDTYNVSTSDDGFTTGSISITDKGNEKDKYNITNAFSFTIKDEGTSSKDTYNIKNCVDGGITDDGGNDTYTFTGSNNYVSINDKGGKDTLNLKGINKDNIVYMTDVMKEGNFSEDYELIIYDTESKNFVEIYNFFSGSAAEGYTGLGDGRIETLKYSGKTDKQTDFEAMPAYFTDYMQGEVGRWLKNETSRADVVDVLLNGTDAEKGKLVEFFTTGNTVG